jgi:hypothetical protein
MTDPRNYRWVPATLCLTFILSACQVAWVSRYSGELQRDATAMLSDVVAWESHMHRIAGTAAADPRNPEVQARLDKWQGDIEAMSEVERAIDPGSTACDKFLATIGRSIGDRLQERLPAAPAPISHCETLPGIFSRMRQQVTGNSSSSPGMPFILDQQCRLPWLPDDYFVAMAEGQATAGAPSAARPTPASATAERPSPGQEATAPLRCRSLFEPLPGTAYGNLVEPLVIDLQAIVYREGREATMAATR